MQAWFRTTTLVGLGVLAFTQSAFAHVSASGPGFAGKSHVLTFGVGHGCEGADTVAIEVTLPKEVTVVRVLPSGFGEAVVHKDAADLPTSVSWTKPDARAQDDAYYQLSMRITVPNAPFTTLYFPTKQTCRDAEGKELTTDWNKLPAELAGAKEGEDTHPAPALVVLPARKPGWNKFTAPAELTTMGLFDDAQIVWVDNAAYSSNEATAAAIKADASVDELTSIKAGAEIWVKY